jgi:hypothetical protein
VEFLATTRQNFVAICLMANIPDEFIIGRVKHVMKGDGQFNYPQTSPKVPAEDRHIIDNELAKLIGKLEQTGFIEFAKVVGRVDGGQQWAGGDQHDT